MSLGVGTTAAQTPLVGDYGNFKKQVASYVQGASLTSVLSDAGLALNSAVDRLNTRVWNWALRSQTITLVASTRTYTVNADFKKPRKLEKIDSSGGGVGCFAFLIPKEFLDADFQTTGTGSPECYTVRNAADDRLLQFNIAPSSGFISGVPSAGLHYYARVQHFSDDGDTPGDLEIPPEVSNFLIWYGRWELATTRGSAGQIKAAETSWMRVWHELVRDDLNEQTDWAARSRYR